MDEHALPTSTVFLRLGKAYNTSTQAFEALTGVGAARWRLLYLIANQPRVTQKELIRLVRVDPGSITRQLKAMEEAGLITRSDDEKDMRLTRVALTAGGRREVQRVLRLRARFLKRMVSGIRPDALQTCLTVLDAICINLGDDSPSPPT